jgi:hypothetical protein
MARGACIRHPGKGGTWAGVPGEEGLETWLRYLSWKLTERESSRGAARIAVIITRVSGTRPGIPLSLALVNHPIIFGGWAATTTCSSAAS